MERKQPLVLQKQQLADGPQFAAAAAAESAANALCLADELARQSG